MQFHQVRFTAGVRELGLIKTSDHSIPISLGAIYRVLIIVVAHFAQFGCNQVFRYSERRVWGADPALATHTNLG